MSKLGPYPGRFESHDSWMRRYDEWENNRNESRRSLSGGLRGRPNRRGIETGEFKTSLKNGAPVTAVKIGYGWRASCAVEKWAAKQGFGFERFNGNGCSGMCERLDGIAYEQTCEPSL